MKRQMACLLIVWFIIAGCQPSESAINTVIAKTQAAIPIATLTFTPNPTSTPKPTATPKPMFTQTPKPSLEEVRKNLLTSIIDGLSEFTDIESVTSARFNNGALEIELKTIWASQERQPVVSFTIVKSLSEAFAKLNKENLEVVVGGPFTINLTTYSVYEEYRYTSVTDWDTLVKLAKKSISFEEWVLLSSAGFIRTPVAFPTIGARVLIGALCNDGISSSATGQGACSQHQGVKCWKYSDGSCTKP